MGKVGEELHFAFCVKGMVFPSKGEGIGGGGPLGLRKCLRHGELVVWFVLFVLAGFVYLLTCLPVHLFTCLLVSLSLVRSCGGRK